MSVKTLVLMIQRLCKFTIITFCSLLASCVVVEKDIQHVIPINVDKTISDEVTISKKNYSNKPICNNNNLFCN